MFCPFLFLPHAILSVARHVMARHCGRNVLFCPFYFFLVQFLSDVDIVALRDNRKACHAIVTATHEVILEPSDVLEVSSTARWLPGQWSLW